MKFTDVDGKEKTINVVGRKVDQLYNTIVKLWRKEG